MNGTFGNGLCWETPQLAAAAQCARLSAVGSDGSVTTCENPSVSSSSAGQVMTFDLVRLGPGVGSDTHTWSTQLQACDPEITGLAINPLAIPMSSAPVLMTAILGLFVAAYISRMAVASLK